jgi:hypothetical protein
MRRSQLKSRGNGAATDRVEDAARATVLKRFSSHRRRGGNCLAALFRRRVPLGFALRASRIDRIDAAFQLIARLIRKLARSDQTRARRLDVAAVDCT